MGGFKPEEMELYTFYLNRVFERNKKMLAVDEKRLSLEQRTASFMCNVGSQNRPTIRS